MSYLSDSSSNTEVKGMYLHSENTPCLHKDAWRTNREATSKCREW